MTDDFERFWEAYPRKVSKGPAERAWTRAIQGTNPDTIMEAVEVFKTIVAFWPDSKHRYIPTPENWLNGRRWEDDPVEWERNAERPRTKPMSEHYHDYGGHCREMALYDEQQAIEADRQDVLNRLRNGVDRDMLIQARDAVLCRPWAGSRDQWFAKMRERDLDPDDPKDWTPHMRGGVHAWLELNGYEFHQPVGMLPA